MSRENARRCVDRAFHHAQRAAELADEIDRTDDFRRRESKMLDLDAHAKAAEALAQVAVAICGVHASDLATPPTP